MTMDPLLVELLEEGDAGDEVEVILKLKPEEPGPPGVRIVTRFGPIATCRLLRGAIPQTHDHPSVLSVKAPRLVGVGELPPDAEAWSPLADPLPQDRPRQPRDASGRGSVIGFVDWGFDFVHPNLRRADGSTRLLALWDQANPALPGLAPYGYGVAYRAAEIDAALAAANPYRALGYHPSVSDPLGSGTHGTHVADIAAGGGLVPGSIRGVAPDAALVFVHLAARSTSGLANLGDTVRILEALDFIAHSAGARPWVANLSIGRCGGPHDGLTLVEQGIDALLQVAAGCAVVQSTGNYHAARTHARGVVRPGEQRTLGWETDRADITPNELEIWYSGRDRFLIEIAGPGDAGIVRVPLDSRASIMAAGKEVGRVYHRAFDPVNGDHHVDVLLDPAAPPGIWRVALLGEDLVDGRFHAWVERDAACPGCQSRLLPDDADPNGTTGTICNGFRSIAVGAYDAGSPGRPLAPFSSRGPTRDGRRKPDLIAPGVRVLAARSQPDSLDAAALLTRKSGTSMAAPHVTGTIACMFEAAGRPLPIAETRHLLLGGTEPWLVGSDPDAAGSGFLDPDAAVQRARAPGAAPAPRTREEEPEAEAWLPDASANEDAEVWTPDTSADQAAEPEEWTPEVSSEDRNERIAVVAPPSPAGSPSRQLVADAVSALQSLLDRLRAPARLFDAVRSGADSRTGQFIVLAEPNQFLASALQPGDVLLRRGTGEPGTAHVAVLTSGHLLDHPVALPLGTQGLERAGPGRYAQVIDLTRPAEPCARRVSDARGLLSSGQLLLRLRRLLPAWPAAPQDGFAEQVPPAPPAAPPPAPYGGYDLTLGDRDDRRRWGGVVRQPATDVMPAAGQRGFVAQLQADLHQAGIWLVPHPPSGRFDENTRWAVRELQLHGKLWTIAQQAAGAVPAGQHYSDTLTSIANPARYGGRVSGVLNADTRSMLQTWIASRLRCPVVIEAWQMRLGVRHRILHENLWRHTDLQNTAPRMFARDFSDLYTMPAGRIASDRLVLGEFTSYGALGGPQSQPPNHTWTEAEILPDATLFPPVPPATAAPTLATLTADQRATFKVIRAVSEVECEGFYDGINSYDDVFISLGHFHAPLGRVDWADGGELGAILSLFQDQDATAFEELFGFCGIRPRRQWNITGATLFSATGQRRFSSRTELQTETGFAPLPTGATQTNWNIYHWFRSWHWFYRFAMAARTSAAFRRILWDYARVRLRELLDTPWDGTLVVTDEISGMRRLATIGDFYTSERAVALILRWHVRFPAHMASGGNAGAHLRSAFTRSGIALAGDPLSWALADETALVNGIFAEIQAELTAATAAGNAKEERRWRGLQGTMTEVRNFPTWVPPARNPKGFALDATIGSLSLTRTLNTRFPLDTTGLTPSPQPPGVWVP
jgi:subtilisin family serine protease